MDPTIRGTGTTATERSLAKLAEKTFLDLWSYPNTYNDRDLSNGQGKELCDLLVLCGNDLLIFSDKNIRWPSGNIDLAWRRWYRRAIQHSVDQIKGAERWLRHHPDRVFIDPACRSRLPIPLPNPEDLRVHGIAVVSGAREACRSYMNDRDGGLMLTGHLRGDEHLDPTTIGLHPFMVGDANPDGAFVHVMDMDALTVVMRELDTISDFVAYLRERADAIRDRRVSMAASEADLLAAYLMSGALEGRPFIPDIVDLARPLELGIFHPGHYEALRKSAEWRARREFNRGSYDWDRLISSFSKNLLDGTSVAIAGMQPELHLAEQALRKMALERRIVRRSLSRAFMDAYFKAEKVNQDRFARLVMPPEGGADPECLYLFLVLAFRGDWLVKHGYDYYREARGGMLKAYCQVALMQHRGAKRIVGIALDASSRQTGRVGRSEDIMLLEVTDWTNDLIVETRELQEKAEILLPSRLQPAFLRQKSMAEMDQSGIYSGNRSHRRAARAKARQKRRSPLT